MTKKKIRKKTIRKKGMPDIDIKVRNLDKMDPCKSKNCYNNYHGCGNCWIFGSALAMILSYERSASILWTILHGFLSWFYVLYRSMQIWGWF